MNVSENNKKDKEESKNEKVKSSALVELGRRTSLSLSVFTFALLGFAFGIETGRNPSKKQLLWVLFLATLQLIAIFASREYKHLPHLILPVFLLQEASHENLGKAHPLAAHNSLFADLRKPLPALFMHRSFDA